MDMKQYYAQVRELQAQLAGPDAQPLRDGSGRITDVLGGVDSVVIVSRTTPDGGKPGVFREVTPYRAARLIADGFFELATPEQSEAYRESERRATEEEKAKRAAQAVKVTVVTGTQASDLEKAPRAGRRTPE